MSVVPPRLSAVVERRSVLWTLVRRDLRVRYASSVLGYVWTILDPLLMTLIYFVVFTYILGARRAGLHPYLLFLISGMLPWQWFTGAVHETSRALLAEAKLVRSTNLPRELWVIRVIVAKGIEYLLSLPVLAAIFLIFFVKGEARMDLEIVYFPLAIVLEFALLVGIGLLIAPITVLVTDLERVVRIALRLMFYLTPVIYGVSRIPAKVRHFMDLNPMSGVLELFRAGLFSEPVNWRSVGIGTVIIVGMIVLGSTVFARLEPAVLKEI